MRICSILPALEDNELIMSDRPVTDELLAMMLMLVVLCWCFSLSNLSFRSLRIPALRSKAAT